MPTLDSPVALFIFNRPDTTAQVLDAILKNGCKTLYVVADGPRPDRPGEAELCMRSRSVIERARSSVNLVTDFADRNLGLRDRLSSGLDWVFQQTTQAIILEDDCLPDDTFFPFCDQMLKRYADQPQVMMVSGNNFLLGKKAIRTSYYFSHYVHIWGWATWRRAWKLYDLTMSDWQRQRNSRWLNEKLGNDEEARFWHRVFDDVYSGRINTWDYQWGHSCLANNGLSIVPSSHLVTNLGVNATATNTFNPADPHLLARASPMAFPLRHPATIERDVMADHIEFRNLFARPSRAVRLLRRLRRRMGRFRWPRSI